MDNKEIALQLTVAAMNNKLVGNEKLIEANLIHEEVADFYHAILENLNFYEEDKE